MSKRSHERALQVTRTLGALLAVVRDRYGSDVAATLFRDAIAREQEIRRCTP